MATVGQEFGSGIAEYRAINRGVHVGHVSFTQCKDLQASAAAQNDDPATQLDAAWLGLELSLAMTHSPHPETNKPFGRKELAAAKQNAQTGFRTVLRNEDFPISLRAAAGLGLASVAVQHEMAIRLPYHNKLKADLNYGLGIQKAAELLLSKDGFTPEDDKLLYSMASIALMTEYLIHDSWFLPTPSRQWWDINVINRRHSKLARISISETAAEGVMAVPGTFLGDACWSEDGTVEPHRTLREYLQLKPGVLQLLNAKRQPTIFGNIASDYLQRMNVEEDKQASQVVHEVGPGSEAGAKLRPEMVWYLAQPAEDFRGLNPATLRINIINMVDQQEKGELKYYEQYLLGWMQLDYARALTDQVQTKRREAVQARTQAARISRADAPPFIAAAEAAEAAAEQLMEQAQACFDVAEQTFTAAAEATGTTHLGEAFEMRLNAASVPVYKALFTEASAEVVTDAVATYRQDLIQLYDPLRAAYFKLQRNPNQQDAVDLAALMAGLSLLVMNSSDEVGRDLVLPASPRRSGKRGEMDLTIFPLVYDDGTNDTYDTQIPVNLQLVKGADITHERGFVSVGMALLAPRADMVGFYARLVAAARAINNPEARKKRLRDEALDNLTYEITNAIADAAGA